MRRWWTGPGSNPNRLAGTPRRAETFALRLAQLFEVGSRHEDLVAGASHDDHPDVGGQALHLGLEGAEERR